MAERKEPEMAENIIDEKLDCILDFSIKHPFIVLGGGTALITVIAMKVVENSLARAIYKGNKMTISFIANGYNGPFGG